MKFLLLFFFATSAFAQQSSKVSDFKILEDSLVATDKTGTSYTMPSMREYVLNAADGSTSLGNCTSAGMSNGILRICGNPTGFALRKALLYPYRTDGGRWRLQMNLNWSDSSATAGTLGINGVDFYDAGNNGSVCVGWVTTAANGGFGSNAPVLVMTKTGGQIEFTTTGSHNFKALFCDFPLQAKPKFIK